MLAGNVEHSFDPGRAGATESVPSRVTGMVRHLYGFAGYVKVRNRFVPAHVRARDPAISQQYGTLAF